MILCCGNIKDAIRPEMIIMHEPWVNDKDQWYGKALKGEWRKRHQPVGCNKVTCNMNSYAKAGTKNTIQV